MVRRHQVRDGPIRVVAGALGIFYIVCVCVWGTWDSLLQGGCGAGDKPHVSPPSLVLPLCVHRLRLIKANTGSAPPKASLLGFQI